jgi:hypothetical protein
MVGCHVSAAVPTLSPDTEEADLVGIEMTIEGALLRQRRRLRGGSYIQPLGYFLRNSGSNVHRDTGSAADLLNMKSMESKSRAEVRDLIPGTTAYDPPSLSIRLDG